MSDSRRPGPLAARSSRRARLSPFLVLLALVPLACVATLRNAWSPDSGPVVPHDTFPADCSLCHAGGDWQRMKPAFEFDHAQETGLPLFGAHKKAACLLCHNDRGPAATFAKRGCAGCHEDVHHGQLGKDCKQCHSQENWQPRDQIAKHRQTRFPLTGAHVAVACFRCHPGAQVGNFKRAPVDCASCHQADLQGTTNPNHIAQGWTRDCQRCHVPTAFKGAAFNHAFFPLVGAHAGVQCAQCHKNGNFNAETLSTQCASCHLTDFQNTTNPNHQAAGFPTNCEQCHEPVSWQGAMNFAMHDRFFPLVGVHRTLACAQCHTNGQFKGTPRNCVGCHLDTFNRTTNPNHQTAGFATNCEQCHSPLAWKGTQNFNHDTIFPLTGTHKVTACALCHKNGQFKGTARVCAGCHLSDYNATTKPSHVQAGFPTTCDTCHNTTAFQPSTFDHNRVFALTGAHMAANCTACHVNGVFKGTPRTCVGCHLTTYNATTNPNHAQAGFPTTCENCHTPTAFKPANFNHDQFFALTGTHKTINCSQCHANGKFKGTSRTCVGCHLTNYNATTNPNHAQAGFPTTCDSCHTTTAFKPSTFDHNRFFPLVGQHTTVACNKCHVNGTFKGTVRLCAGCHLDDYNRTLNPNHRAAGFPTTCQTCHSPNGWKPANFIHTFDIKNGPHRKYSCVECHRTPSNFKAASCTHCHEHTKTKMDDKHKGRNGYSWSSPACIGCHPKGKG